MRSKYTALVLAAALLAATVNVFAGENPPPRPDRNGPRHEGWRDRRDGDGPRHNGWRDRRDDDGPGCGMMGGRGMRMMGHDGFGPGAMGLLQLDAAQKAKVVDMMTENFRAGLEARMEMDEARQALRQLQRDDNATAEAIVAANTAMGAAKGKMDALRMKSARDMEGILTPEQKTRLDAWRDHKPHDRSESCQFGDSCRMGMDRDNMDRDGKGMGGRGMGGRHGDKAHRMGSPRY